MVMMVIAAERAADRQTNHAANQRGANIAVAVIVVAIAAVAVAVPVAVARIAVAVGRVAIPIGRIAIAVRRVSVTARVAVATVITLRACNRRNCDQSRGGKRQSDFLDHRNTPRIVPAAGGLAAMCRGKYDSQAVAVLNVAVRNR